jgi:hypothetical protein
VTRVGDKLAPARLTIVLVGAVAAASLGLALWFAFF